MFLSGESKLLLIIRLTVIFEHNYLLPPVDAVNGVIWSKNKIDFVELFSIQSFAKINKQRLSSNRKLEKHDFNGAILRLTSFPIENLVEFTSNDTAVTGVHGDAWQLLAEMFNFKIQSIKLLEHGYGIMSKNGSWNGLMGYIYRNETDIIPRSVVTTIRLSALDYTFVTWMTTFPFRYRFHMKEELEYHTTWMVKLFSNKLWLSIIGTFFALTLASFLIHVFKFKNKNSRDSICNLWDHFFYIFSTFCIQGWSPHQLEKLSKILVISTRLCAWILFIAFSSMLISHIAQRKFYAPFDDLQSFYKNTNYKLVVKKNSFINSIFRNGHNQIYKKIIKAGRFIEADITTTYKNTCTGKYVYLEAQDIVEAENSSLCKITSFGKPYLTTWIAGGLVRGFKYKKTIDSGMLRLQELGIINRLKSYWLKKPKPMKTPNTFDTIQVEHVYLIFAMLLGAILLSLILLIIENIYYFGRSHGRRRHWMICN